MLKTNVRRVRVVEEDLEAGSALALLLTAAGYDVETTFQLESALIGIGNAKPEINLLDLGAPQLHASDLARQLRQRLDQPLLSDEGSFDAA